MDYLEIARRVMRERENRPSEPDNSLEAVLKGRAVELWSDRLGERLWIVSDEHDAKLLREPRGVTYSAAEVRCICRITDPDAVAEIHRWKRRFNGVVSEESR